MRAFLLFIKILSSLMLLLIAPFIVILRRSYLFVRHYISDFFFLSRIDFFDVSDLMETDLLEKCSDCYFRARHVKFDLVVYRPLSPFVLYLVVHYLWLAKGIITKQNFIKFLTTL